MRNPTPPCPVTIGQRVSAVAFTSSVGRVGEPMSTLRIEMDRGNGWELRGEGPAHPSWDTLIIAKTLANYALQYPHRALIDGVVVAERTPGRREAA